MGATLHRGARASHYRGLCCCGAQAPDAQAQYLWLTGLVAPRHVGSSQTRARTRVPCIGRQILNHCATREALQLPSYFSFPLQRNSLGSCLYSVSATSHALHSFEPTLGLSPSNDLIPSHGIKYHLYASDAQLLHEPESFTI